MVAGDAADQSATADAFRVLHVIAAARLRRGLLTVVDATNLTRNARRVLQRLAAQTRRPAIAIVFDISLARCLRQNAGRIERQVPEHVIHRQHGQLQAAIDALPAEGFAQIVELSEPDMDGA